MSQHTVVLEPCPPQTPNEEVKTKITEMLAKLVQQEETEQSAPYDVA